MAHESFEDNEIADILNRYFVSIKVDKEERPDIDSIYMAVCQAFTGSGGWPTSIFMTYEQKPFFAGTYFPRTVRFGTIGLKELLMIIREKWDNDRDSLLRSSEEITKLLKPEYTHVPQADLKLIGEAVSQLKKSFDREYGGFGDAPKFPVPHNLLMLMKYYQMYGDDETLNMAEITLAKMYAGGLFDHMGYGFCRYSTDRYFLVPHFEKMLYDNGLLILAYSRAYQITRKAFYKEVAEKTAFYILTEMTSEEGGFFSAQDADSDGEEGKYYLLQPDEIINLLGAEEGKGFNQYYNITDQGNFEGKSIPNLLHREAFRDDYEPFLYKVCDYRRKRNTLHTDDKILTTWNSLMIAAFCQLYRVCRKEEYLCAARKAQRFLQQFLSDEYTLYVSFREGKRGVKGFLEEYASYIFALLALYDAALEPDDLEQAVSFAHKAVEDFFDEDLGGFYLSGRENESLIIRMKESYDGAMPSGNSMMTYNLVRLHYLKPDSVIEAVLDKQVNYMSGEAADYPAGYGMFLTALCDYFEPPKMVTVVLKKEEDRKEIPNAVSPDSIVKVLDMPTEEYQLLNDKTTFYVCENHRCLPPVNM